MKDAPPPSYSQHGAMPSVSESDQSVVPPAPSDTEDDSPPLEGGTPRSYDAGEGGPIVACPLSSHTKHGVGSSSPSTPPNVVANAVTWGLPKYDSVKEVACLLSSQDPQFNEAIAPTTHPPPATAVPKTLIPSNKPFRTKPRVKRPPKAQFPGQVNRAAPGSEAAQVLESQQLDSTRERWAGENYANRGLPDASVTLMYQMTRWPFLRGKHNSTALLDLMDHSWCPPSSNANTNSSTDSDSHHGSIPLVTEGLHDRDAPMGKDTPPTVPPSRQSSREGKPPLKTGHRKHDPLLPTGSNRRTAFTVKGQDGKYGIPSNPSTTRISSIPSPSGAHPGSSSSSLASIDSRNRLQSHHPSHPSECRINVDEVRPRNPPLRFDTGNLKFDYTFSNHAKEGTDPLRHMKSLSHEQEKLIDRLQKESAKKRKANCESDIAQYIKLGSSTRGIRYKSLYRLAQPHWLDGECPTVLCFHSSRNFCQMLSLFPHIFTTLFYPSLFSADNLFEHATHVTHVTPPPPPPPPPPR
jgi:hypothetical protein